MTLPSNCHSLLLTGAGRPAERPSSTRPAPPADCIEGSGRRRRETGNEELCRASCVCVSVACVPGRSAHALPRGCVGLLTVCCCVRVPITSSNQRAAIGAGAPNVNGGILCRSSGGSRRRANHPTRRSPSAAPRPRSRTPTARSSSGSRTSRCPSTGARSPPTSWPRSISARPACPTRLKRARRDAGSVLAVALQPPTSGASAELPENERIGGESDARQVFDRLAGTWTYWGWKGGYFTSEDDARAFFDEHRYMLAMQMGAPNSPAMVQHRPALGLRHRRPRPGPLLRRPRDRRADRLDLGLRASPAARLLHPVDRGRSRQRERHHGPVGARGAPVQVRLRHRLQLLQAALARTRSCRAAASRRA